MLTRESSKPLQPRTALTSLFGLVKTPDAKLALVLTTCAVALGVGIALRNLMVVFGILAIPVALLAPVQAALGVYALLIPFDAVFLLSKDRSLTWLVGAAAAAILLGYGIVADRLEYPPRMALWWVIFAAWTCATTFWAIDPSASMERLSSVASLALLYLLAVSFRVNRSELKVIVFLLVLGAVVASAWALFQFAQGTTFEMRASISYGQEEANPNDLSSTLFLPLGIVVAAFMSSTGMAKRILLLVAAGLFLACILLTMSRGGMVAAALLLAVCCYRLRVRWRILVPLSLAIVLMSFLPELFFERLQETFSTHGQGRFDIWLVGWEMIKHHPVIGVGFENFRLAYNDFAEFAPIYRGLERAPHNIYLETCAEGGVIGLLLLGKAIWSHVRAVPASAFRRDYLLVGIEAGCWAMVVHSMVANHLWQKQFWMCWMLLLMALKTSSALTSSVPDARVAHERVRSAMWNSAIRV